MQSTRIIFGTSVIILLLFSFPKSFGFRNDICSRETQPNCQDQPTNIYHRFEKHDNSIREVDVKRERLLQIRSLDNDPTSRIKTTRDRSVARENYSRISPESINRERINRLIHERSVNRRIGNIRDSRNINLRERISIHRDIRNIERSREISNENSQFRTRDTRLSETNDRNTNHIRESQERREILRINPNRRVKLSARKQTRVTERLSDRIREFRDRENQSNERRSLKQNSRQTRDNTRNNPERDARLSEQRHFGRTTVRDTRSLENTRERLQRVTTIKNSRQSRECEHLPVRCNNERNSIQRNTRSQSVDNIRVADRIRESRERVQERERVSRERYSYVSERRNSRSRSIDNAAERTRESRERINERERLSPERSTLISERRNDVSSFVRHDRKYRSVDSITRATERTRELRERTQQRERLSPERNSRIVDSYIRTTDRTRISRERIQQRERDVSTSERRATEITRDRNQEHERLIPERDSRLSERRNNKINSIRYIRSRSLDSNNRAAERSIQERERLSYERDARISERRNNERNSVRREIRTRSTDGMIRATERTKESRERITPERDTRISERRNNERNSRQFRQRFQERERLSPERYSRISENSRNRENRQRLSPERESRTRILDKFRTTERNQVVRERQQRQRDSRVSERRTEERISINRESSTTDRQQSFPETRNVLLTRRSIETNIHFGELESTRRNTKSRSRSLDIQTSNRRMNTRDTRISERRYRDQNKQERDIDRVSRQRFREFQSVDRDSTLLGRPVREQVLSDRERHISNRRLNTERQHIRDNRLSERHEQNRFLPRQSRDVRNVDRRATEIRDSIRNLESRERQHDRTIVESRRVIQEQRSSIPIRFVLNREIERNIKFVRESQERRENMNRDVKEQLSRYVLSTNSHKLLKRDTNPLNLAKVTDRRQNNDRLSRMSRNSERLIDNNRRINVLSKGDTERLGHNERISDRRLVESRINILSKKQNDGFQIIADQRAMNIFRLAYPTKVQDFNLENQNIWINVVKILLACLLFLQISRNKTADLKMFKSIRIPMFSQLFKEKVQ